MKILLVIAYLSSTGVASIKTHEFGDMKECREKAVQVFKNVRVGSARVWCQRVITNND